MEIKIELDLPAIISQAVSAERIQPIVDKAIADAIKSAINDATGYNSEFRKQLESQMKEALPKGLGIDDCAKFQFMLNSAVTSAVNGENSITIQTALRKAAASVLPEVPDRIKLSDLINEAREGFHKESYDEFFARLDVSDYGYKTLFLDSDPDTRENYRADIRISFNKEGEVYSLHLDGRDITPKELPHVVGRFDGLLMSMYVGRTTIEADIDSGDVEYACASKED